MSTLSYIFTEELTKFTFNLEETHEKSRFDDDIEMVTTANNYVSTGVQRQSQTIGGPEGGLFVSLVT